MTMRYLSKLGWFLALLVSAIHPLQAQTFQFSNFAPSKADPKLKKNVAAAINSAGSTYIIDAGTNQIHVFDANGAPVESIKEIVTATGPVGLKKPVALYIDQFDNLYIADAVLVKILVKPAFGQGLAFGEKGNLLGQIDLPLAVAADQHGFIYVLNGKRKQIDVFMKNGDYFTFISGGSLPFTAPVAIGVNGKNELYVLESKGPALHIFDQFGASVKSYPTLSGISKAVSMAVLRNGEFLILDAATQKVSQFSKEAKLLGTVGSKGKKVEKGVLLNATSISAGTGREKGFVILDAKANQAQVFSIGTATPALQPDRKRMQFLTVKSSRAPLSALATAPNGTRYALKSVADKKLYAFKDTTSADVFPPITLGEPVALATDLQSNVFVIDKKSKEVFMFDAQGTRVRKFGQEKELGPNKLKDPVSIAIQSNGNILVADKGAGHIHLWNQQGSFVKALIVKGTAGLELPVQIALDSKDLIYILDGKKNALLRFGADGTTNAGGQLSVRGELPGKPGVISKFYIDPLDQVHVFNSTTSQLEVFQWDQTPAAMLSFGRAGGSGFNGVESMLMDPAIFRAFFSEPKGKSQKVIQFVIKPPVPENVFVFDTDGSKLHVSFNALDRKEVVGYALITAGRLNPDSVIMKTDGSTFTIDEGTSDPTPRVRRYRLASLSATDMSEPTAGFENHFGYANRLYAGGRFEEALTAYQIGIERLGRPVKMIQYVSSQLTGAGRRFASAFDINKAMLFLRSAYALTPESKSTINGLVFGYTRMFQQMANQEDFENLVLEAENAIQTPTLRAPVLSLMDSISVALSKQQNENSINQAVNLQKKLLEWDENNPSYLSMLANTSYALYKFKRNAGSPGFELDVVISEAQKFGEDALAALKSQNKPFLEAELVYLELLNAGRRYNEAEQLALTEMRESSAQITKPLMIRFRKQLAEAYRGQAKFDLSVMEFQRALQLEGDNAPTKIQLADVLIQNKKFDDARLMYQQLLLKDRENAEYIARIGKIELLKQNYDEASFQLEKAIKLRPADRSLYGPLAEAFDGAAKGEKALENYKIAIQYLEQRIAQARNQMTSGDEINQLQTTLNRYLANVANIYLNLGMFEEAIVSYQRVTQANPSSGDAFFGLGQALLSSGLVFDAMKALYRAKTLDPNNQTYANAHFSAMSQRDQMVKNEPPFNVIDVRIKEIFPSLYKNYGDVTQLPIGEIILTNNTPQPAPPGSVTVSFIIPDIMNEPTQLKVPALVGFSNAPIKVTALFDETKILAVSEDTKMQATVVMKYRQNGEDKEVNRQVQVVVHGRNAISWSDKRRLASFVSPNVDALINYNKQSDVIFRDAPAFGLNKVLLKAIQVFTVLNKSKFVYSPDPEQSFALVTTNTEILDYLQYPAETLKRKSGDCDDLVTVFCGLLENAGITTAYVDVPGHVFMAFDSGIKPDEVAKAGFEQKDVIVLYEKVWIPVETTLLGTQSFLTAWKSAAERYYKEMTKGNFPEIVPLGDARKVYNPSNFVPVDFKEEPPASAEVLAEYQQQVTELLTRTKREVLKEMENRYKNEPENVFVKNKYAMLLAQIGKDSEADKVLLEALSLSPGNPAVLNNLGNVAYFRGDADRAIDFFTKAANALESDGEIYINLAKACLLKNDKAQAKSYYDKAIGLDNNLASIYDYLAKEIQ